MSYDFDDESANFLSEARNSERYSTMSSMVANYEHKISNISNELKMVSQKVTKKLKDYGKNRSEILSLYSNMIELSHHMNETLSGEIKGFWGLKWSEKGLEGRFGLFWVLKGGI